VKAATTPFLRRQRFGSCAACSTDAPTGRSDLCGRARSHGIQITSWTHDVQSRRAPSPHSLVGHRQHKRSRQAPTSPTRKRRRPRGVTTGRDHVVGPPATPGHPTARSSIEPLHPCRLAIAGAGLVRTTRVRTTTVNPAATQAPERIWRHVRREAPQWSLHAEPLTPRRGRYRAGHLSSQPKLLARWPPLCVFRLVLWCSSCRSD